MRHAMALAALLTGLGALPSAAQADGHVVGSCHAYADSEAQAHIGAKSGYAARYAAALKACRDTAAGKRATVDFRQPRRAENVVRENCPPGAPKIYRGTIYCVNGW